ncbi:MAG: Uma2 family endonuclease, partial [Myxococcota bacterium]
MALAARSQATVADLLALPDEVRAEVIGGEIVEKAAPSGEHSDAQTALGSTLWPWFNRRPGGSRPGGWWIRAEVDVEMETHEVYRPDLAGWRRDRVPERPTGRPIRIRPDWVCEVLSDSNANNDLVVKLRVFHRNAVPHYWIADPERKILTVHRWQADGYLVVLTAR